MSINRRVTKLYKKMTPYLACAYADGFCEGKNANVHEQLTAWQYIYDKGLHHNLQGHYGRTVEHLLETGELQK